MKGLGNMGNLMKQAKQLQEQLEKTQAEIAETKIDAAAGGGMVTATVNGRGELLNLRIEPEVVDPDDIEMLTDLVIAAIQEAQKDAQAMAQERLGPLTKGLGMPMGLG